MKKFNKIVALLLVAAMAFGLVACTTATPAATTETKTEAAAPAAEAPKAEAAPAAEAPAAEAAAEPAAEESFEGVHITWLQDCGGEIGEEIINYIQNPIIEKTGIDLEIGRADSQTVTISIAGGAGPDIVELRGESTPDDYVKAGKAVDLTPYAEKYGWAEGFIDWAYQSCIYDGKLYFLPNEFTGVNLVYNMDVMNAHGWTIPTTLDELIALCEEIKAAGLTPIEHGMSGSKDSIHHTASLFLNCCCDGVDNLKAVVSGKEKWNENQGIRHAFETMISFYKNGYIEPNYNTITSSDARTRWNNGESVILVNGLWNMSRLGNPKKISCNWQVANFPAQNAGEAAIFPCGASAGIMINANSENQDAAAKVLDTYFFGMQEEYEKYMADCGGIPKPCTWTDTSKVEYVVPTVKDAYGVMFDAMNNGNYGYYSSTWSEEVTSYITDYTDTMIMGEMDLDSYLAGLQDAMEEDIANGNVRELF